jgi:predicted component of type VI protein secretion system
MAVFSTKVELEPAKLYELPRYEEITVGCGEENTVVYNMMNLVSNCHCVIRKKSGVRYVFDTSSNGLYVNNKSVNKYQ